MDTRPRGLRRTRAGLRLLALLVPIARRERWLGEWDAEFVHWWRSGAARGRFPSRLRVARRLFLAARDALAVRLRPGWLPDGGRARRPHPDPWNRRVRYMSHDLWQDVRFGLRSLGKRPLFSLVAVSTLGLGIGGTTAIFTVVDGVLLEELPYRDPRGLVSIWKAYPPGADTQDRIPLWNRIQYSWEEYIALRDGATLLDDVAVYSGFNSAALTGEGEPERVSLGEASANLFRVVGVQPALGRDFLPGEDGTSGSAAQRVVILGDELWQRRYGGDPGVLGHTIQLNQLPFTVVGVMPPGFRLESFIVTDVMEGAEDDGIRDLWIPIGQAGDNLSSSGNAYEIFARPGVGVTLARARAEALALLPPELGPPNQKIRLERRRDVVRAAVETPLLLLLSAAGLLLLIACANVAGLLLGEAVGRRGEIAVRSALGAGRYRVTRQLLTESAVLGVLGSAAGIALAWWGTGALVAMAPPIPRLENVAVSGRVLLFAVCTGMVTGLLFGLAPVSALLRGSPGGVLSRRGSTGGERTAQGRVASVQVALTVVLLAAGGLMARSVLNMRSADPGFDTRNLATFRIAAPAARYPTLVDASAFFAEVARTMEAVPGVTSVAGSYGLPFPGGSPMNGVQIPGTDQGLGARRRTVLPSYHETMGIELLEGRYLSPGDDAGTDNAMVVSASMAARLWPSGSGVGSTLTFWGAPWTVVGVVADVRHTRLNNAGEPTFYVPLAQAPRRNLTMVARTSDDAGRLLPALRTAVWAVDPDIPVTDASTMEDLIAASGAADRYRSRLLGVFAILATLLSAAGIFGITARGVAQRRREIGIRLSLGSEPRGVMTLVLRSSMARAVGGVLLGMVAAVPVGLALNGYLVDVPVHDPLPYGAAALLLLGVCATAALLPAFRAARVSPMSVIREE